MTLQVILVAMPLYFISISVMVELTHSFYCPWLKCSYQYHLKNLLLLYQNHFTSILALYTTFYTVCKKGTTQILTIYAHDPFLGI